MRGIKTVKIHKRAWLLIGIFTCSAAAILAAGAVRSQKPQKHVPFTITFKAEDRYNDGRVVQAFIETRYVSSTGDWRSVRRLQSGALIERVGIAGRGVYTVDAQAQKMWFNSPYSDRFPQPGERLRSDGYVRTETIAGFSTDVVRVEVAGKSVEFFQAPNLNNFIIKQVERSAQLVRSIEPTSITLGEPAAESLKFPEYAEDMSLYKPGGRLKAQSQDESDNLPITDFTSPAPSNLEERARQTARSKRYNNRGAKPIEDAPSSYQRVWSSHWAQGLTAIPVSQSDLVLIGEVIDAQAYLSEDKTGVYSEFKIRVGEVMKNDNTGSLYPGATITADRPGGGVRFPSGHVNKFKFSGQGMPYLNRQYLFFLKRSDQTFSIITGYELRGERIFSLDGSNGTAGEKLPFDEYNDTEAQPFLKAVREAITQAVQTSSGEGIKANDTTLPSTLREEGKHTSWAVGATLDICALDAACKRAEQRA
jgi:hypothetical protein